MVILIHEKLECAPDQRIRVVPAVASGHHEGRGVPNVEDELFSHLREMLA